jgi:hypothetical protein
MINRLYFVFLAISFVSSAESRAAEIKHFETDGAGHIIEILGTIQRGDAQKFTDVALMARTARVVLISDGGVLADSLDIGRAIRLKKFSTYVPDGATCASGCAMIWLAGTPRSMSSKASIGFHAAYNRDSGQVTSSGNAVVGSYLNSLGLSDKAIYYLTSAPPAGMLWLAPQEAEKLGISVIVQDPEADRTASLDRAPPKAEALPQSPMIEPAFPNHIPQLGAPCPEGFGNQAYCVHGYYQKPPDAENNPTPPPDELAELRSEALDFVNRYIRYGNEGSDRSLRLAEEVFEERVFHFGKMKTKQEVLAEEARHWERWPKQIYNLRPESVSAACALSPDQCTVDAILDWDASNLSRNEGSTGSSTWHVVLSKSQGSMTISAMGGEVINKRNYKLNQEPEFCLGPFCLPAPQDGDNASAATEKRRLRVSSSDGVLNLRDGPGTGHTLISSMPAGSIVRQVGRCVKGDDNVTRFKWCNVEWNGSTGWASAYGLELAEAKPE